MNEAFVRRKAKRLGLALRKSRDRNPELPWVGTYQVINDRNVLVFGDSHTMQGFGMSLQDCAGYLDDVEKERA